MFHITFISVSSPPLGAIAGALLAGFFLEKCGRKMTLMMSVLIAFIAFLMLATSNIHEIVAVMITARALQGMSVGFSMASATIYVSFLIIL